MHVDAFFEYLEGKQPPYCTQIPPLHCPFPEEGRDGVPLEEDLAIRALDPKFRPKRGRRRAGEEEDSFDANSANPPKRPHLDTALAFASSHFSDPQSAYPNSAVPMSAHPDGFHDPWADSSAISSAITSATLNPNSRLMTPQSTTTNGSVQQYRWRLNTQENPTTPHPLSATPVTAHPESAFEEPQSAVTPGKPRSKRRHGPAVSSAWPSRQTEGKLRGRPPSNRSVRDGPFVTFPANPLKKQAPPIDINRNTPGLTPVDQTPSTAHTEPGTHSFRYPPTPASAISMPTPASAVSMASQQSSLSNPQTRPERLQLQVPQHVGGPVHLVTPTVLVNGETDGNAAAASQRPSAPSVSSARSTPNFFEEEGSEHDHRFTVPKAPSQTSVRQRSPAKAQPQNTSPVPVLSFPRITQESLKRALAADLLRANISGRKRLRGVDAKNLADSILKRLGRQQSSQQPLTPKTASDMDQMQLFSLATLLGLSSAVGLHGANDTVMSAKKIVARRFRTNGDGYDSPIDDEEDADGEVDGDTDTDERVIKESLDISWTVMLGGLTADCGVKDIVLEDVSGEGNETPADAASGEDTREAWKRKWEEVCERLRKQEDENRKLKEKVLDVLF
jgi:hypothetical protein